MCPLPIIDIARILEILVLEYTITIVKMASILLLHCLKLFIAFIEFTSKFVFALFIKILVILINFYINNTHELKKSCGCVSYTFFFLLRMRFINRYFYFTS